MLGVLYVEDERGEVYPVEVDLATMKVNTPSGPKSLNQIHKQIYATIKAAGSRIRIPKCLPGNARSNPYSCFRCSCCHRPLQASRKDSGAGNRAREGATSYPCLYIPLPPLTHQEGFEDGVHWFGGKCKTKINQDS